MFFFLYDRDCIESMFLMFVLSFINIDSIYIKEMFVKN